ncbi:MAG: hypothetical protein E7632_10860 [Ruminococcaceae bacterium]|nr:hypothetical protein [Oscillospiraceae bacterium]
MRILLFSDIHYTTDLSQEEMTAIAPRARVSAAAGDAFGLTQREKLETARRWITAEHERSPLDAVLMLGDLSIDDYNWRNLPENYCEKCKKELFDALPCPVHAIPGNHDSYPDQLWREIFGTPRQYSLDFGDFGVIMLDTFANTPCKDASGSHYSGIDRAFVAKELVKFGSNPVLLCAHHVNDQQVDWDFAMFCKAHPNIRAIFRGHTHKSAVLPFTSQSILPLIDIGGIAYDGFCLGGRWTFGIFNESWAWGYQILEFDGRFTSWHVKPPHRYVAENGIYDFPGEISAKISF